jgi:hypothetical protein
MDIDTFNEQSTDIYSNIQILHHHSTQLTGGSGATSIVFIAGISSVFSSVDSVLEYLMSYYNSCHL